MDAMYLGQPVLGFTADGECLDCILGNDIVKINRTTHAIANKKTLFCQKGLARDIISDRDYLYIKDFCHLYILKKEDYSLVRILQLGTDLSSDICELTHNDHFIYACIRNGPITVVSKRDFSIAGSYGLSGSTVKSIQAVGDYLVCGNVEGRLLIIEKAKMELLHSIALHRQNLRSLIVEGEDIYTAGQDKQLFRTKLSTLVSELLKRNVHRKMFDLVSLYRRYIVTVSYPSGEIRFIDKDYPNQDHVLPIIPSLVGTVTILDDTLYLANRAIDGITAIHLDKELSLQV